MTITITNQGVLFPFTDANGKAVQGALRTAKLCGWKVRGLRPVSGDTYLAVISRTGGAAYQRQLFADRLAFEAGLRGVVAEVTR